MQKAHTRVEEFCTSFTVVSQLIMSSTNLFIYIILHINFYIDILSANTSIEFGIEALRNTNSIIKITLFWAGSKYQCNVYPTEANVYYKCDLSNTTTTMLCDVSLEPNPIEYGLQIDNDDWDSFYINSITISQYKNHILHKAYYIDCFIFNSTDPSSQCESPLEISDDYYLIPINISSPITTTKSLIQIQNESARCIPS